MVAIAQRLNLTKDEIKPDIKLLKESRIRTAGHLYVLNQRKEYWDKLDLPLLIKKRIRRCFTRYSVIFKYRRNI